MISRLVHSNSCANIRSSKGKKLEISIPAMTKSQEFISKSAIAEPDTIKDFEFFSNFKEFSSKYDIIEEIGNGFQAKVYKICDILQQKDYAAKVYQTSDPVLQQIFKEKDILQAVTHENVIKFIDFHAYPEFSTYILVTEFFNGQTLKQFLLQEDESRVIDKEVFSRKLLNCLDFLHRKKLLHRDLNVENVLISPKTHAFRVIDFGLALNFEQQDCVLNDEGNFLYRIRDSDYSVDEPAKIDLWGALLIVLSLHFNKIITTREAKRIICEEKQRKAMENAYFYEILAKFQPHQ